MSDSFLVKLEPMGHRLSATGETPVRNLIDAQGVPLRFDCGGKGVCGKCRVIAVPPEGITTPNGTEREHLREAELEAGWRLACQSRVVGPVTLIIPDQFLDVGKSAGKTGLSGSYEAAPLVQRVELPQAALPEVRDGLPTSLSEWIDKRLKARGDMVASLGWRPEALRDLARPGMAAGSLSLVVHRQHGVTTVLPGKRPLSLGMAVDIGTTTVAGYLCDMTSGAILSTAATTNPQRRHGEDVVSRIAYADGGHLDALRQLAVSAVNTVTARCAATLDVSVDSIDEIALVGNTTMVQIFAGLHPHGLGQSPYLPIARHLQDMSAADAGLSLNPGTNVHILPVVSGFVGADALGAALAEAPWTRESSTLIIDIGTNGELVLWDRGRLWATSCATGPALEGAQISHGMRAVDGAIQAVELDDDGIIRCQVLGPKGTPATGICGSGLIDAIIALRRLGALEENGAFNPEAPGVQSDDKGIGRGYALVEGTDGGARSISISLKDVRQFQLAKSALWVGIKYLLRKAGLEQVDRTVLTGAFGARFNWRNAFMCGMFPHEAVAGEVVTAENLAGQGAVMALLHSRRREEAVEMAERIRFVELAAEKDFADDFASGTRFPALDEHGRLCE